MPRIHVIHENPEWSAPLFAELEARGLPFADWDLSRGRIDLESAPPPGVFYSRMSASAHSRDHRFAPEFTAAVLAWLESRGARVLNGSRALALEVSKVAQYAALRRHGIRVPRTVAALGRDDLLAAARTFDGPFVTKHNRAGKGLGVRRFEGWDELEAHVDGPEFDPPVDGITLVQAFIESPTRSITRVELIGGELLYAVEVDASGGFELCPADDCAAGAAASGAFCPAGTTGERFVIREDFRHPLVEGYRRFMAEEGVDVAAFEMVTDAAGEAWTYDVNTNTNYNPRAEARAGGRRGMAVLADHLGAELAALGARARRVA